MFTNVLKPFCSIQFNHESQLKQQIFIRNKHIFTKTDISYYKHMIGPRYDVIKLSARSYRVLLCDAAYDVHKCLKVRNSVILSKKQTISLVIG